MMLAHSNHSTTHFPYPKAPAPYFTWKATSARRNLEICSTAILMLPSGLITFYKAAMWNGGAALVGH
ncbi:hypothetical protein L484_023962 [Morus notabilis]|uniref:Uncharacterized protein n=1 Tax=Morus notabilis TaxID=981085 RepID=W9R8N2_9ROSA|nr:hypothetical protein L484_023962 [Morus notabilis]